MEAIRQYVLAAWGKRLSQEVLRQLPPVDDGAGALAAALRLEGIPVQSYRLANSDRVEALAFPFIAESDREWVASRPDRPGREGLTLGGRARFPELFPVNHVLVAEPPMGEAFFLEEGSGRAPSSADIQAAIFYCGAEADAPLAEDQLIGDLECIVGNVRQIGRDVLYFDFRGDLPTEVLRLIGGTGKGFRIAIDGLRLRLRPPKHSPSLRPEVQSPIWDRARRTIERLGVEVVQEGFDSSLMNRYISLCQTRSAQTAAAHLVAGQLDQAAMQMGSFLNELHRLDCDVRNTRFVRQVVEAASERGRPVCILAVRDISHYGMLERLLSAQGVTVQSKILGAGRFASLTGVCTSEQVLGNLGVRVSAEEQRTIALRECLRHLTFAHVVETQSVQSLMKSLAGFQVDALEIGRIESLMSQLQDPSRVYLRSHPYNQGVQEQLVYMLKSEGILPAAWIRDPVNLIQSGGEKSDSKSKT